MAGLKRAERQGMELIRVRAVKQILAGVSVAEVVRALGVTKVAVYSWVRVYDEGGFDALKSSRARGAKPKLSVAQMTRLRTLIVGADPRQLRFELGAALFKGVIKRPVE